MPKIIENLQHKLIAEAGKQVAETGYAAMTIRSVAAACGVGVGTVYNYFPSKEALLAASMLEDWKQCVAAIGQAGTDSVCPEPVMRCIYDQLLAYAQRHQAVFTDEAAAAGFTGSASPYHTMLRNQLASPIRKFCGDDFTAEFAAEALLTWSMAGKSFDEIYGILEKLF